ncbi:transcriptional regulator GcvA [Aestuariispira insulae]|nr:transcriptional regulator GcvA [Aestuariispira insulae]
MRRLPPLTALRAFEAAARHLNYSRAAEELNVTHAAISQQIRQLEDWFAFRLFRKEGRSMILTDAGQRLQKDYLRGFDILEEATKRALGLEQDRPVQITTTLVFASRWLMPRLGRFNTDHPAIRIKLDSTTALVDYDRENIDIGVRYGAGRWPGLKARMLIPGDRVPMCSPLLLEGRKKPEKPADLFALPFIHDVDQSEWEAWFRQRGIEEADLETGTVHTMSMLAYQAALEGHGLFLGVEEMAKDDLESGRLVMPLGADAVWDGGYFLVLPEGREMRPPVRLFHDWLLREVAGEKT